MTTPTLSLLERPTLSMKPMEGEEGIKGWYIDAPDFYCDIERKPGDQYSVFIRGKDGAEGFAVIAQPEQPEQAERKEEAKPNQYEQAIDDELVNCFLGTKDDFKDAKSALIAIIDWNCKVALDPAVSAAASALVGQAKSPTEILDEHGIWLDTVVCKAHFNNTSDEYFNARPQ